MKICEISSNKKKFLPLLLLADEQESMVDRYLERGTMFVLYDDDAETTSESRCEGTSCCEGASRCADEADAGEAEREAGAECTAGAGPDGGAECKTAAERRSAAKCAVRAECVVTDEGDGILEIKNIATDPAFQGRGYGRALIEFVADRYRGRFTILQVGTGDSPLTVPFYERCGFTRAHSIPRFFLDNYDHPIFEAGVRLVDMVYLRREL